MQRRGAGDHDEEADHAREDGSGDDVHELEPEILGRRRLSTAYDWMNASPQGAIVVPTVAVITSTSLRPSESDGTTAPRAAADQSGPASAPAST